MTPHTAGISDWLSDQSNDILRRIAAGTVNAMNWMMAKALDFVNDGAKINLGAQWLQDMLTMMRYLMLPVVGVLFVLQVATAILSKSPADLWRAIWGSVLGILLGAAGAFLVASVLVPNLVWLPRQLAKFSDNHLSGPPHPLHEVLKSVSRSRYISTVVEVGEKRLKDAWLALGRSPALKASCNEVVDDGSIVKLVNERISKLEGFLEASLLKDETPPSRFSKRYHAGVGPRIDFSVDPIYRIVSPEDRRSLLSELRACKPIGRPR